MFLEQTGVSYFPGAKARRRLTYDAESDSGTISCVDATAAAEADEAAEAAAAVVVSVVVVVVVISVVGVVVVVFVATDICGPATAATMFFSSRSASANEDGIGIAVLRLM
jgi:hypothetical protein